MPSEGFAIVMQLRAKAAPYAATVKAISFIADEVFDHTRLAGCLAAWATLFHELDGVLAKDLQDYDG